MVMIDAKLLSARHGGAELQQATLRLAPGRHALLGRPEDGVGLLLACIAGEVRPRHGELKVLGGSPRDPKVRARVGFVPLGLVLPDVLRVDEMLTLARQIRGDASTNLATALADLGLEALAHRPVHTLDPGEVRAVALAEVLASKVVSVVLIEEPFATMAAPAAAALPRVLAAQPGKCVVIATASAHDASRTARDFALFDRGRLLRIVSESPLRETREQSRIHVLQSGPDARALAAELAKRPEVEQLELLGDGIVVSGKELVTLAAAVNAAIIAAGVEVQRIEPEPTSLEALRADAMEQLAHPPSDAAADVRGRP
jgi:ABC-2 type transport system ATP-binding protein